MKDLLINVDGNDYNVKFDAEDKSLIYVNDKPYSVDMLKKFEQSVFSFSVNQRLLTTELDLEDDDNMLINYDGLAYKINVTDDTRKMLSEFIKQAQDDDIGAGAVVAPMPGMVVKIFVKEGDDVQVGDKLVAVEAMKMENVLKSPVAGKVIKIPVLENQAVEKNALLIEVG